MGTDDRMGGFVSGFMAWAASERVAAAAAERARTRSLGVQAAGSSTWTGILTDVAERGVEVMCQVGADRLQGRIEGVGRDFAVMATASGRVTVVAGRHVSSLRAVHPQRRAGGGVAWGVAMGGDARPGPLDYDLGSLLAAMAEERSPVGVHTPVEVVEGDLTAAGEDVITIIAKGRRMSFVPMHAVAWVDLR